MKASGNLIALYVLSKKPLIRYGAVIILLAAVSYAWSQFVYRPLVISAMLQKKISDQLEINLFNVHTETTTVSELNKQVARLQSQLELFNKQADERFVQEKLFALITTIKSHHLTLIAWQPEPVRTKDWYQKQRVSCTLQGNFEQFISFFSSLEKRDCFMKCTQLIFERQDSLLRAHCLFDYIFKSGERDV